ncbi:MAG: rod shape-determining protein MreC [Planctomycetes bacterium]|nr:rod shape-determining protein MreC [Planctomycetota bacterium]
MKSKRSWILLATLAAGSVVCAMLPEAWHSRLNGRVLSCTAPAQSGAYHMRAGMLDITRRFGRLLRPADGPTQLERARREIRQLRELLIAQRSLVIEKERKIAGLTAFERFAGEHGPFGEKIGIIPARIIGRDATPADGIVFIDKGSAHGVRSGAGAVWGHAAVGVVTVVNERASYVHLITSPARKVPAYIQRTGESTIVSGHTTHALQMHHVFRERVKPGDICLTSGLLSIFPRGIIIGEVTKAWQPPGSLFQKIEIRPQINPSDLQTVIILVREKKKSLQGS